VEIVGLREGQGLSCKAAKALPKGAVPAFNMICFPRFLSHGGIVGKNLVVGVPVVAECAATPILGRNPLPKLLRTLRTAVPDVVGHNLPCAATERDPNPALVVFGKHV